MRALLRHVRPPPHRRRLRRPAADGGLRRLLRSDLIPAMLDLILGGIVSLGLLVYLVWALLRPEDL
ncbi:MAG: K(+)-transporting ATPase subunit F [Gluconacetobacter diazotrophicus]|nr:K(+)-transporting ATPase subunit F [Gluconacetobacter diazotrophicus]